MVSVMLPADHNRRLGWWLVVAVSASLLLGSCVPADRPTADVVPDSASAGDVSPPPSSVSVASDADVVVQMRSKGSSIGPLVFGTNVPAWLGAERLRDPEFQRLTVESGTTSLRMPGGSWSNVYDWLACEQDDETGCRWPSAARPSDFIEFMKATGLPGVWAISMYETAQSAAAAVAFFNGAIDDETVIGIDRDGVDWGTVGRWAQLRAANGSADPAAIHLWEVGNEVYGGVPAYGGAGCEEFGWEEVWTCNGTEYVEGDATHDGYRDIRKAMLAVDPTIEVGAVGLGEPSAWSNWGSDVIAAAGDELDFYSVHHYGYDTSPDPQEALFKPAQDWRDHFGALGEASATRSADRRDGVQSRVVRGR